MRAIKCIGAGGVEVMKLTQVPIPTPGPNEVLIKVHATALNRADLLQRRGLYPPPTGFTDILGLECSGEISGGHNQWPIGTRVMGFLRGGGYAEYVTVHKDQVLPIPSKLSYTQAAGLCEVFLTAYKCLFYLGKGQSQENVLVHAGASGVGLALIQLAKWKNLKVFTTCGSSDKEKICKDIGADFVWNYKSGSFLPAIKSFGGADLIMDSVGANYFPDNISCLNKNSRWVIYGFLSGSKVKDIDLAKIFAKLCTLHFTSFRARSDEFRNDVIRKFIADGVLEEFENGRLKSIVYKELGVEDVQSGHLMMEKNENIGKIVVRII